MNQLRTMGIVLIIVGIVAFSYEGVVKYRTRDNIIDAGPVQVTAERTHHIYFTPTAGAIALIGGVALLVASARRV
jgi:hypothetical protein